jgi:3-dehydroquinate synthase
MQEILLKTPSSQGRIRIGAGCVTELSSLVCGQKNFVVTDSNVYGLYRALFEEYFSDSSIFVLPAGEENKNFENLSEILSKMARAGLSRTSCLFAVGGGVVGDIGGLAAALYMRGIACVQVPTTLLAQIDSSVGGKTAIDHFGVKNIVGAFYQPKEVLIDSNFLKTLPKSELKCGLGELVKYAALNVEIYRSILENEENLCECELDFLTDLIGRCVKHKVGVVERDEKENGERKSLNVGHTTGHAIELFFSLSHGESVLYGLVLETKIAINYGVCEKEYGQNLLKIIKKAIEIEPKSSIDLSCVRSWAIKANMDKKNTEDGKICLAVAKSENEWAIIHLAFDEYCAALENAIKEF